MKELKEIKRWINYIEDEGVADNIENLVDKIIEKLEEKEDFNKRFAVHDAESKLQ